MMPRSQEQNLSSKRIAIAGLGEIGKTLARKLAQGMPGLALTGNRCKGSSQGAGLA